MVSKKCLILTVMLSAISVFLFSHVAIAHPGDTDDNGCHYCLDNCDEWGLKEGEYHCPDKLESGGYLIEPNLWIRAVIHTEEKGSVEAVWQEGGRDKTEGGDKVIWGYFYASPDDVNWGSEDNPDVFVKIWFDRGGRVDVNYFHVSVPDIYVFSDYPYDKNYDEDGTVTTSRRYIRQFYMNSESYSENSYEDGNSADEMILQSAPTAYSMINNLKIGAIINTESKGPIDAVWRKGGDAYTAGGHQVLWGHFYASPGAVNWGSENNPDLFVKVWFDAYGRVDVNFFHVSVPSIEVYSDLLENGNYNRSGTTIMDDRYIRHEYQQLVNIETDFGDILMWLYNQTPGHKGNFLYLTKQGFYDNLIFHRVIDDFMIQGGDPLGTGTGGPGYTIEAEILPELRHVYGAVAAARRSDSVNPERSSSGSQFYIVEDSQGEPHLDDAYTVFGMVIDGMDAVETIASVETDENDRPLENVYMKNVDVVLFTEEQLLNSYEFVIP